jgi:ParB family chromosome partitioning protein
MADKMWDILRFLKNPEGELLRDDSAGLNAETEKKQIDARLISALQKKDQTDEELSAGESEFLTLGLDQSSQTDAAEPDPNPKQKEASPRAPEKPAAGEKPSPEGQVPPAVLPQARQSSGRAAAEKKTLDEPGERLLKLPIADIKPNPFQPRRVMGENEITELSESIRELGVLQPILVKAADSGYELIAGERRLRAAQRAGLAEIPAVLLATEPLTQQIIALVENIQRKNLSAIEEAACLQDIISKTGWSQTELSKRLGRSQASIANKMRLLRLDQSVQELVLAGKLGERQARSLLSLSMEEQRLLAQKAVDEDLSARALETLAENWHDRPPVAKRPEKKKSNSSDGPAGELLGDLAALINRNRNNGISAQWKVKQMNQSSLVVEISVDLMEGIVGGREAVD